MHGELFDDLYAGSSVKAYRSSDKAASTPAALLTGVGEVERADLRDEVEVQARVPSVDLEMLRLQRPTWMSEEQAASGADVQPVRPVQPRLDGMVSIDHRLQAAAEADSAAPAADRD